MGSVKKKMVTRPLPANATVSQKRTRIGIQLVATWKVRTGNKRTAVVVTAADGSQRIQAKSETYYAKFRDGDDIIREVVTGCRDKQAALMKLAELQRLSERVRSGVIDGSDLQIAANLKIGIVQHLADYLRSMESAGTSRGHVADTKRKIEILTNDCGFVLLRDVKAEAIEKWLVERQNHKWHPGLETPTYRQSTGF